MAKRRLLLLPAMALACGIAFAGEPGGVEGPAGPGLASRPANPLAGLPSRPGPHIEKIKALGDDSWLDLGCPAADPGQKDGVARGRSWGGRAFAYAPDLEGAFFCGTGVHGYVKPDGHFMDDLWFYDVKQHRWICLYPGADTKTLRLKLDEHGFEVNEKGEHIPVSYLSHANSNMTYDGQRRKLMIVWLNSPTGPWPCRSDGIGSTRNIPRFTSIWAETWVP